MEPAHKLRVASIPVFSDNGTNYVEASRQLSAEIQRIKTANEDCATMFTNVRMQCHFKVPGRTVGAVEVVKVAMTTISDCSHQPSNKVCEIVTPMEAGGIVSIRS